MMAPPPPSTPTPHRFLVPKRTGTQQSGTPKPLTSGSQQFHATPRFSLHSTPRGNVTSSSTTPAPPPSTFAVQRPQRNIDDSIHDIIDSSPIEQPPPRPSYGGGGRRNLHDSIEVDSEPPSSAFSVLVPSSQHQQHGDDAAADAIGDVTYYYEEEEEVINEAQDDGPSAKRRRLSVSSDVDMEPPIVHISSQDVLTEVGLRYASEEENPFRRGSDDDDGAEEEEDDEMMSHDDGDDDDNSSASPPNRKGTIFTQKQQHQHQPKFQPVPRFKAPEVPEPGHREPLPEAFSPRRRGEKYVTGGLAAELRDWLMNIETATGNKRDGGWAARLLVEEVRTGSNNMKLVRGSQQRQGLDTDGDGGAGSSSAGLFISKSGDVSSRVILAGEGRVQGLAKKSEVAVGCLVGVARPVWEVDLGSEGQWVVACDWAVLSKPP
ncbi:Sterol 3-beta-glucosyltransferase UGT80A2 [Apiospora arundinis]|uniref:Sterol 3-beta-glucosyltransferase UGT80A2 n=1 Tax=Apiospora arundinis TaxID=335852 RepID=A0ABR2JI84_9PEZI